LIDAPGGVLYHESMTKLYLAGPMRTYEEFNFPAFRRARVWLRSAGFEVFCPAERDELDGFSPTGMKGTSEELATVGFNLREALGCDLNWICQHADGIALLDGWELSSGAKAEVAVGNALGIPHKSVDDWLTEVGWSRILCGDCHEEFAAPLCPCCPGQEKNAV
jgi:nucleoside 2-deoxyribosyltransferase